MPGGIHQRVRPESQPDGGEPRRGEAKLMVRVDAGPALVRVHSAVARNDLLDQSPVDVPGRVTVPAHDPVVPELGDDELGSLREEVGEPFRIRELEDDRAGVVSSELHHRYPSGRGQEGAPLDEAEPLSRDWGKGEAADPGD